MSQRQIEKQAFYPTLIETISSAESSVLLYSVSCCFGFYSFGLRCFEEVLTVLKDRLGARPNRRYLDVRAVLKIDSRNEIDMYAIGRLARLERLFEDTGDSDRRREVFREVLILSDDVEKLVQFVLVDGKTALISESQDEQYVADLDLVLNKAQNGVLFDSKEDPAQFSNLQKAFEDAWVNGRRLDVTVPQLSMRRLLHVLKSYRIGSNIGSERDFQLILTGFVQGEFHPAIVDMEAVVVESRVDLLVGPHPHHERVGIEVKWLPKDQDIDRIVGQIRKYRRSIKELVLVAGRPQFSPQQQLRLKQELSECNVEYVEIQY